MNENKTAIGQPSPARQYHVAKVAPRALLPRRTKKAEGTSVAAWRIIWVLSLCMTFEASIRSIGQAVPPAPIRVLPGLWLSDLGLMLPIMVVLVKGQFGSALLRNRGLMVCLAAAIYGVLLGAMRNNWFSAITTDIRVFAALVSGLCLVEIAPKRLSALASGIVIVSAMSVFLAAANTLLSPYAWLLSFLGSSTNPSAFVIIGLSVCLLAPAIVLSSLVGSPVLSGLGWLSAGSAVMTTVLVMRTRTLSLVFIVSILTATVSVLLLARLLSRPTPDGASSRHRPEKGRRRRLVKNKQHRSSVTSMVLVFLIAVPMLLWQQDRAQLFLERLQQPVQYGIESDINLTFRVREASHALETMQWQDHLVGMGFGVQMSDFEMSSDSILALHIGVLNLWWRLGVFVFVIVAALWIRAVVRYLQDIRFLLRQPPLNAARTGRAMTNVICVPGVITLGLMAVVSGGWGISPMMSLGMLWGIQRALSSDEWRLLRASEA